MIFESYLLASGRAPMPLRALEWTEMKSLMNLKVFRTLNRYHISKIHENGSDSILVTTARDHLDV